MSDEYDSEGELSEEEEEEEASYRDSKSKGKRGRRKQAADDDEDEEEEEEDDKRKRARIFFDEQADVDDEDEDEGDDEEHDDIIDDDFEEAEEDAGRRHEMHADMRRHREQEMEHDPDELENFVKERYERRQDRDMDEGDVSAIGQQSLLPTIRDTKLWVMQCRPGMEREIAICMMQKFWNMMDRRQPLPIKSVFFQDHLKGYIYIEADKESHVKESMGGMRGILFSKGVKLVPIAEMVDAVTVNTKAKQQVDVDSWVRIKSGVYKGDLARVVDVDFSTGRCTVKLVPRLDYHAMANKEARVPFGQQPKVRPVAKAFSFQEAKEHHLDVEARRASGAKTLYILNGNQRFEDGYALRSVSLKGVTALGDALPPIDELQRFNAVAQNSLDDDGGELSSLMKGVDDREDTRPLAVFEKGDKVIIVDGDLKELTGRVIGKEEDGKVIVMPEMQDLNEALTFDAAQLSKFFVAGDHVKCINGKHTGNTGMVVKSENGICVVFSDMTQKEFRVFARDLSESQEVATGEDKIGDHDLHDLVVLDHQTVGVIVHVEKDSCRVLTNQGTPDKPDIRVCRLPDIKRSIPTHAMRPTTDQGSNQVAINDQVSVADGPLKGRVGIVKYIHRGMLFIQTRDVTENAGFFAIRSRNVRAKGSGAGGLRHAGGGGFLGGSPMTPSRPGFTPQSPAAFSSTRQSPYSPGPGGRGTPFDRRAPMVGSFAGRANHARRDNSLVGQTIRIKKGPWCGYNGRVVDATESILRLELEAQNRTVTVSRASLNFTPVSAGGRGMGSAGQGAVGPMGVGMGRGMGRQDAFGRFPAGGYGGQTPMRGSQTPSFGGATPAHPSMTPAHPGSATPRRGSQTPIRDSAWNPMAGAATPVHPGASSGPPRTPADDPYATTHGTPMTPFDKPIPGTPGGGFDDGAYAAPVTPGGGAYTPYAMADTPRTPADHAYTPAMTPGDIGTTPGTPGGGYATARTPYDSVATPGGVGDTPFTPGMPVSTPGTAVNTPSHTPYTPGGALASTPGTPGMEPMSPGLGGGSNNADSMDFALLKDLLVTLPSGEDGADDRPVGVVVSVDTGSGVCIVQLGTLADDGNFEPSASAPETRCQAVDLTLVVPQKKNAVKIVRGEQRGQTGSLIGVDVADGIVKLDESRDIKILEMSSLGRLAKAT